MVDPLSSTSLRETTVGGERTRPLRVLIAHYLPHAVSGAERSIADLVEGMDSHFSCSMLVPGDGNLAEYYRQRGLSVWIRRLESKRRLYPGLHTVQSYLFSKFLHRQKIDVVLANTFSAASRVGTAARMAGIPFGIYVREYISDRPVHRKILDQADRVFTISKDLQSYIQAMTAAPEKVLLTYNHIHPQLVLDRVAEHRKSPKRYLPFGPDHHLVGLIGRITRYKQQDVFVRAIPLIAKALPDARFVIVGSAQDREKDYEREVKQLAHTLGIHDKLAFMGQRKEIAEITSELSISCVTSNREPLGRVILEAGLIGCPVVVPDTGGPAEIVEDGVTGLKFSAVAPDADQQLADRVIRLLRDPGLRQSLAAAAKERIWNTFAGPLYVKTQEQYIEQLASLSSNGQGNA